MGHVGNFLFSEKKRIECPCFGFFELCVKRSSRRPCSNSVEQVDTHTRAVERKLRDAKSSETAGLVADSAKTIPRGTTGERDDEGSALF